MLLNLKAKFHRLANRTEGDGIFTARRLYTALLIVQLLNIPLSCVGGALIVQPSKGLLSIDDNDAKSIAQSTQVGLDADKLRAINNDVELFHEAMKLKSNALGGEGVPDDKDMETLDDVGVSFNRSLAERASPSLFARIVLAAKDAIAPARHYFELIRRYRDWRNDYIKLRHEFGKRPGENSGAYLLREWQDLVRIEYAKLDAELINKIDTGSGSCKPLDKGQSMDFILMILNRLIERLEARLLELKKMGPDGVLNDERARQEDAGAELAVAEIEQNVKAAAERAGRIVAHSAANLAARELLAIMKVLAFNSLATYVTSTSLHKSETSLLMSSLEPIVLLLGNANSSLMVSYLRDIQFRATLNLVDWSWKKLSCPEEKP